LKAKYRFYVWVFMLWGGAAAGIYFDLKFFRQIFFSLPYHAISLVTGILLLRLVIRISRNTGRTLARYGRKGEVPALETNVLVSEGPYRYMRHPMHLGLLFFPLSIALITGSPTFSFIIAPLEMLIMLWMIYLVEEPEVRRKFGKQYDMYARGKPWFCLKPECLKVLLKDVPPLQEKGKKVKGCF